MSILDPHEVAKRQAAENAQIVWQRRAIYDPASLAGVIREAFDLYSRRGPGVDLDSVAKKIWNTLRNPGVDGDEPPKCATCGKPVWEE